MKTFKQYVSEMNDAQENAEATQKLRTGVKWGRKPMDWEDTPEVSEDQLTRMGVRAGLLDYFDATELWHGSVDNPTADFDETPPADIFLMNVPNKGNFLVKREGADYVRYAVKVTPARVEHPEDMHQNKFNPNW